MPFWEPFPLPVSKSESPKIGPYFVTFLGVWAPLGIARVKKNTKEKLSNSNNLLSPASTCHPDMLCLKEAPINSQRKPEIARESQRLPEIASDGPGYPEISRDIVRCLEYPDISQDIPRKWIFKTGNGIIQTGSENIYPFSRPLIKKPL